MLVSLTFMPREERAMKPTFDDDWLGYLAGHAHPLTRVLHCFGLRHDA